MNNEQMERFLAASKAGLKPEWYYYDFESGKDITEGDITKLLRVARAVKAYWGMYPDVSQEYTNAQHAVAKALVEVEHLL